MKKDELIAEVVNEVQGNMCNYEDFVLDCVREVVSKWGDEDLRGWVGNTEDER